MAQAVIETSFSDTHVTHCDLAYADASKHPLQASTSSSPEIGSIIAFQSGESAVLIRSVRHQQGTFGSPGAVEWSSRQTFQQPTDWGDLFKKLDSFLQLPAGWDGYKASSPNTLARDHARVFLALLAQENYGPSRVAPSVIGGIGITRRRSRKVYVEFNNNGNVHALFSDGSSSPKVERVQVGKIEFQMLIRRMRAYLDE
jgi:hypothetical protein